MEVSSASRTFDPKSSAVLVVDVQNDFCDPRGAFGRAGLPTSAAVQMLPRLERLIRVAHTSGSLVVFIRTTHDETTNSPAWLARTDGMGTPPRVTAICRTGTWGAEFYRVEPRPDDPIVTKHRYSAFCGTNLDVILRTAAVRSLFVTGVATETCVESTLRDGLFHEYFVALVEDCCASDHPDAHAASVSVVRRLFGPVMTSDELAARWRLLRAVG